MHPARLERATYSSVASRSPPEQLRSSAKVSQNSELDESSEDPIFRRENQREFVPQQMSERKSTDFAGQRFQEALIFLVIF